MRHTVHTTHAAQAVRATRRWLRAATAGSLWLALGACWPQVEHEMIVDSSAAGATQNRGNTTEGLYRKIAPPGQGSTLSDTSQGRTAPAGVTGPTQALSKTAPEPRNANARTRSPTAADTARRMNPYAPAVPVPGAREP